MWVWPPPVVGTLAFVRMRKVVRKKIRHQGDGIDVVADVNGVVAGNIGQRDSSTVGVSSKSRTRIVQRSGQARAKAASNREET